MSITKLTLVGGPNNNGPNLETLPSVPRSLLPSVVAIRRLIGIALGGVRCSECQRIWLRFRFGLYSKT